MKLREKCLWCDHVFEWERGMYLFCESCILKMTRIKAGSIESLEKVLLIERKSKDD